MEGRTVETFSGFLGFQINPQERRKAGRQGTEGNNLETRKFIGARKKVGTVDVDVSVPVFQISAFS